MWKMISGDAIAAYNVPSGILFDMHREAAGNSCHAKSAAVSERR